jgi:hypothetical protein
MSTGQRPPEEDRELGALVALSGLMVAGDLGFLGTSGRTS